MLLQSLQLETAATARGHCADTVREISAGSVPPDQAWAREERLFQQLSLNGLFKCPRGYSSIEVRVSARRRWARRTHHCPQDALDAERRGHEAERAALQECIEEMRAKMESLQTVPSYSEAHPNCKYLEFRELL